MAKEARRLRRRRALEVLRLRQGSELLGNGLEELNVVTVGRLVAAEVQAEEQAFALLSTFFEPFENKRMIKKRQGEPRRLRVERAYFSRMLRATEACTRSYLLFGLP